VRIDDPAFAGAVLAKGQRRPKKSIELEIVVAKPPLLDTHCGKPIATWLPDHCVCSIWERGKPADGVGDGRVLDA